MELGAARVLTGQAASQDSLRGFSRSRDAPRRRARVRPGQGLKRGRRALRDRRQGAPDRDDPRGPGDDPREHRDGLRGGGGGALRGGQLWLARHLQTQPMPALATGTLGAWRSQLSFPPVHAVQAPRPHERQPGGQGGPGGALHAAPVDRGVRQPRRAHGGGPAGRLHPQPDLPGPG